MKRRACCTPPLAAGPHSVAAAGNQVSKENNAASHPLDEGVSADQNYLYVLANGLSEIVGYQVGADGA